MNRSRALTLALAALSCSPTWALTIRETPTSDPLTMGNNYKQSVGLLTYSNSTSDKRTVMLIADKFILTAAHNMPGTGVTATVTINGAQYTCSGWVKHNLFNINDIENGYDVSVAKLDRRVTNGKPLPLYSGTAEAGMMTRIIGFGGTGTGATGVNSFPWVIRGGTNAMDFDPAHPRVLYSDFDHPTNSLENTLEALGSSATCSPIECNVAPGDSGGPVLILDNGVYKVCGVSSARGSGGDGTDNSDYGDISVYTRTSPLVAWIKDKAWENGRVQGTVALNDFAGNPENLQTTFEIRNPGTSQVVEQITLPLACDGGFSFVTALRGTFDITVKAPHWLKSKWTNLQISNNGPGDLLIDTMNGDVDGDNEVGPGDYGVLSAVFGTQSGGSNFNPSADLDGDEEVGPSDFSVLSNNFGQSGAD